MITDFNKIIKEWAYRVDDGQPNPKNSAHLYHLSEILIEYKWPFEVIEELLQNLNEDDIVKKKQPDGSYGSPYTVKNHNPDRGQELVKKDASPEDIKSVEKGEEPDNVKGIEIKPKAVEKNKELNKDVVKKTSKEFNDGELSKDGVSDEEFEKNKRVKPLENQISIEEVEKHFGKPLPFPKKYLKVLTRLLNTNKKGVTISDFTDAAGGGTLESTGGEILTMMLTSIEDENEAQELIDKLLNHAKSNGANSTINKKWIESAIKCRKAIRQRYDRQYGEGNWKFKNSAWDVENEVNALGMDDYKENKGFSTDVYFTVEVDGETILDEVSLKQDARANLLNATTGRVQDILLRGRGSEEQIERYDELNTELEALKQQKPTPKEKIQSVQGQLKELENDIIPDGIPDDVNVKVAQKRQFEGHEKNVKDNEDELKKTLNDFDKLSEDEKLEKLKEAGKKLNQRDKEKYARQQLTQMNKMIKHIKEGGSLTDFNLKIKPNQKMMANLYAITGGKAEDGWEAIKDSSRKHSKDVRDYLLRDETAKKGLLKSIREDFPLQSLISGEESMTLGDLSADKGTLKEILGTDNFEEIQQSLSVRDNPPPPSIVYNAGETGEQIPIAEIKTRPDGIGYGTSWKLEMALHSDFAKKLKEQRDK